MSRNKGEWLQLAAFVFDLAAVVVAWGTGYLLRFEFSVPAPFAQTGVSILLFVLPVYGAMFWTFGLYRGLWLFASLPDLIRIVKAIAAGSALTLALVIIIRPVPSVPRTVLFFTPVVLLLIMGGARAAYRATKEFYHYGGLLAQGKPVLIVGAGGAAALLARELARSHEWRLVGFVDDDEVKQGRDLNGIQIFGPIAQLPRLARELKAEHVIVAIPSAPIERQKEVFALCIRNQIKAMVLPALTGLDEGKPFLSRIRSIDLEDLLRRDAVTIDTPHVEALLRREVVMVTGAGGSIGSELCRQIAAFEPALLLAFELSEFALYQLTEEFREHHPKIVLVALAGDVKDAVLLDDVMRRYAPSVVFHAAAYKHVPLMEEHNAWQAIRNNVLGTYRLAEVAVQHRVRRFVLISTDKAVNPTNVMGASKRLAEMVCQALQQGTGETVFETVRFGNVLGSDGSVVPKFQEQIARGGPVTVTHPEVTRYFMTIPEAAQLVLQASSMGSGGEIFMLDMGKPVKIVDLAQDLIRLYGFRDDQIKIVFTGLRPGEKLYEELLADDETTRPTPHRKLRIARAREVERDWLSDFLPWLLQEAIVPDDAVRRDLHHWVPEYDTAPPAALETEAAPPPGLLPAAHQSASST
jgi:FlaA1/EpsC-like NDP-sugar epimerase